MSYCLTGLCALGWSASHPVARGTTAKSVSSGPRDCTACLQQANMLPDAWARACCCANVARHSYILHPVWLAHSLAEGGWNYLV